MTDIELDTVAPHQIVLILDDDELITEGLSAGLARRGRTIITANDLEGGELVVEWLKPSHVVSDVRLTGAFGYEGLDFIRFVKRHSADTRIILMTGDAPEALQLEASERGAVGFLQKPFEVAALDSVLDMMAPDRIGSPGWPDVIRMPLLDEILTSGFLTVVFQPIVKLSSGDYLGYEALARLVSDSPLKNPETLFKYATRKQRVADLEIACITNSLRNGVELGSSAPLFLNIHPQIFKTGRRLPDFLIREARNSGIELNRIVLEITEQGSLRDDRSMLDTIDELKALGVRFAFDDVGVAYSHLPFLGTIRPAFLKISQDFGTGFETDGFRVRADSRGDRDRCHGRGRRRARNQVWAGILLLTSGSGGAFQRRCGIDPDLVRDAQTAVARRLAPSRSAQLQESWMIVHLIDGTYELFRHFYGIRRGSKTDPPMGAVAGVLGTVVQMLEGGATHIGVATDHVIESFRNDLWPGYKTGEGIERALYAQFRPLEEALVAMGVVTWPMVELEADDALASAARIAARDARVEKVCIWTPDKDLSQCVLGQRVVQVDRRSGRIRDEQGVRDKFGVAPRFIADYLALVGDAADGYPGIRGIGPKTAARLIEKYGTIEEFPSHAFGTNLERALLFKRLATLRTDAPLFGDVEELRWNGPGPAFESMAGRIDPRLVTRIHALANRR